MVDTVTAFDFDGSVEFFHHVEHGAVQLILDGAADVPMIKENRAIRVFEDSALNHRRILHLAGKERVGDVGHGVSVGFSNDSPRYQRVFRRASNFFFLGF